jgi:hypothetical protein
MADGAAASDWREPTALLPLRWGDYRSRLLGGLALAVAGGVAIAGGGAITPFANLLLVAGTVAHVAGWAVLPATGWRRVWALIPSIVVMWALLAGPRWLWVLVVPYLGWLLVRHRPWASLPTALVVLAAAVIAGRLFGAEYAGMLPALGGVAATGVLAAWAARAVHVAQWRVRRGRKPSGS